MEIAVAVLDCPFMAAISDLDDVNLKGKTKSPCPAGSKESATLPSAIAVAHPEPPNPQAKVKLLLPTSFCT